MFANKNAELSVDYSLSVPIVVISGDITTGAENLIMNSFHELFAKSYRLIGVELRGSEYINSGGLRILVRIMKESENKGVRVVFISLSDYYLNVFRVMGIDAIVHSVNFRKELEDLANGADFKDMSVK